MWMKVGLVPRSAAPPHTREAGRPCETLRDFFDDVYRSPADFLVFDNGYRTWRYAYGQVRGAAYTFAARLRRERIVKGEKIIFWGENRPEWIVALWGCLSEGVIVVPVDFRSSADLVGRIQGIVQPRAVQLEVEVREPATRHTVTFSRSRAGSNGAPISRNEG